MTTFRIVNHGGTEQYDFDDATTGLLADHASYIEYPLEGQWSVITVELFGDDDWRSKAIDLRAVLNSAEKAHRYPSESAHYLEVDGGTLSSKTRRVIRAGELTLIIETPGNNARYLLTLEVGPREATAASTASVTTSGISLWGGAWNRTASTGGDAPGRIEHLEYHDTGAGPIGYKRLWVGIKPDTFGNSLTGFDSRLYAADMTPGADGTSGGTGATAYIDVQPTDRTEKALATGSVADAGQYASVTATMDDMRGRYRALLVYGVDSTAIVMRVHFEVLSKDSIVDNRSAGAYIQHASGTPALAEFNAVDLGEIYIPTPPIPADYASLEVFPDYVIRGTCVAGTLSSVQIRIYRIILLPIDNGAAYLNWGGNGWSNRIGGWKHALVQSAGRTVPYAMGYGATGWGASVTTGMEPVLYGEWGMPYEGAKIVFCGAGGEMESDYTPALADVVDNLSLKYWPRFRNYKA